MLKKIALVIVGAMLSMESIAYAADYERVAEKTLFNGEKIVELKLKKNGFRVLFIPRTKAKVLTYQVWFDVGSIDEKMDPKLKKTGLAHLFEHMMFRGSQKYPDGRFDEITAQLGADRLNATTHYYRTNYFENIPSRNLEPLMEVESDRMNRLDLSLEKFEKEKGAVVGEYRRHMDNPGSVAFDELMRSMFDVAPYRYTVLGTEQEIKGFSLDEAKYFYQTFYAPNNATLIVVGDTDEASLMKLVNKYYGDMKPKEIPQLKLPEEPAQKKERFVEKTHPQATSEFLVIGYHIPSIDKPDSIPLALLQSHLSSGTEARLRKLLVDKGIAVNATAGNSSKPDLLEFSVQLTENHKAEEALKIIDKEVASLQKNKINNEAFERARNQELLSLYNDISDNYSLGTILGEYLMMCGNYMRAFEIIEGYKTLKPADLQRVAKTYLKKENRSVVVIRPEKKGKS